jgi:hypothetical protein
MTANLDQSTIRADDFQKLLQEYPALAKAHSLIRRNRPETYFEATDKFILAWATPLALEWKPELIIVTNLITGSDRVFETCVDKYDVELIVDDLSRITRFNTAMLYLTTLSDREELTLVEAVKVHHAFIAASGYRHLQLFVDEKLASEWLQAYQRLANAHNTQQREHTILTLDPDGYHPDTIPDFTEATGIYLKNFASTSGLSMAIIAAFPFSSYASPDLLSALLEFSSQMESLLRIVQDACLDLREVLNIGIFTTASQKKLSISDARKHLLGNKLEVVALEHRLKEIEKTYFARTQKAIDELLSKYSTQPTNGILAHFSKVMLGIAQKISDDCKSFRQIEQ